MGYPVYYPIVGDILPILFHSFDGGTGASITMTGLAVTDIEIYKDGNATQRASDAGYTLLDTDGIDFDGLTGIHGFSIDLSDNTDAGFYTVGPWYHIVISAITIDGQTVSFVAASFRILDATRGMAGTALPDAAADAAGGLPISDVGGLDMDAISAEVAKVPKSDGAVTWNATALASIEAECDDAITANTLVLDLPTTAEFNARTLASADYVVTTDTIAGVTLVDTTTDVTNEVTADTVKISGSAEAADNLEASAETIIAGFTAVTGTLSTTQMTTDLTEVTDDHYNGRIIIWTSGVLQDQATNITDYDGASKMLTYTATTEAPSNLDTFVIV